MTEMDDEGAMYGYGAPYEATDAQPDWTGYDGAAAYDASYAAYDTPYAPLGAPSTYGWSGEATQTSDPIVNRPRVEIT